MYGSAERAVLPYTAISLKNGTQSLALLQLVTADHSVKI